MSGQRSVMQAIMRIERFLPTPRPVTETQSSRRRRLAAFVPLIAGLSVALPNLLRDHAAIAAMWPAWREVILDAVLALAIVTAVAAVVSGIVTWRRERRAYA